MNDRPTFHREPHLLGTFGVMGARSGWAHGGQGGNRIYCRRPATWHTSPGREVTSFHSLSPSLPSLTWQGVNPERAMLPWALANSTRARAGEPRLSPLPHSWYPQSTDEETEAQRGCPRDRDSRTFPTTLSCTEKGDVNSRSGTQGRLPGRGDH